MGRVEGPGRSLWGEGELPWFHHVWHAQPCAQLERESGSIVGVPLCRFAGWSYGQVSSRSPRRVGQSVVRSSLRCAMGGGCVCVCGCPR